MTTTTETVAAPQVKDFMPLHGIDHVELWVGNAAQASYYFRTRSASPRSHSRGWRHGMRDRVSHVLEQGEILLVLTGTLHCGHARSRVHHARTATG